MKTRLLLLVVAAFVATALIFTRGSFESPKSENRPSQRTSKGVSAKRPEERLIVGFSFSMPPYAFVEQGETVDPYASSSRLYGIEPDLFKAALAHTGKTFTFHGESLTRIELDVSNGTLDSAIVGMNQPHRPGLYYSKPLLSFENVVVTHKAANIQIEKLADMKGLSVSAWQGASTQHGADYVENLVKDNANYFESTDQEAQYKMFAAHHVEAVVIDKYIFLWFHNRDPRREEVTFHPILQRNPACMVFRDPHLRDSFNEGIDRIEASGEREKILEKYLAPIPPANP